MRGIRSAVLVAARSQPPYTSGFLDSGEYDATDFGKKKLEVPLDDGNTGQPGRGWVMFEVWISGF